jgi:hypothetical protein
VRVPQLTQAPAELTLPDSGVGTIRDEPPSDSGIIA